MTLEELGQLIHKKREGMGLSIDDVAASIKVSARTLRAIESGSLQGLPNAVYTKGFIRSYALLVKIDQDELNDALQDIFPPEAFDDAAPQMAPLLQSVYAAEMRRRVLGVLLLLVVLCGLVGGCWYLYTHYGDEIVDLVKQPFSALSPVTAEIPLVAAANASLAEPPSIPSELAYSITPSGLSGTSTVEAGANAPAVEPLGGATPAEPGVPVTPVADSAAEPQPQTLAATGAALTEAEKKTLAANKHIVHVIAHDDCYLGVTADSDRLVHQMVRANETFDIPFTTSLKLLVGNAGGIRIRYDGKDMGEIGAKAKPRLLLFPQ